MKTILCMGSVTMDMVMRVPRFARAGETVKTDNFCMAPGGKGSNQAVAVARLGGDARYFTLLGGDENSRVLTSLMADSGVDMSGVLYRQDLAAGVAMGQVDPGGQNCWVFYPGSCLALGAGDVRSNARVFDGCAILLITAELAPPTILEALRQAKSRGMTVVMDPSPLSAEGLPQEILELVDYLKPNETEAEILTGLHVDSPETAERALEKLAAAGVKTPLITRGAHGCAALIEGQARHFAAVPVAAVDTTAAGDVFIGGFALALARGLPVAGCVDFARHAAALCVSRPGAQASIPSRDAVTASLEGSVAGPEGS